MNVAIIGYPNVGKSALFNRLLGRREAVVHELAGVTRDRNVQPCEWSGRTFLLTDTGGMDFADDDPLVGSIREQAQVAVLDADVILFVVDATAGLRACDQEISTVLRQAGVPVIVVVNKLDDPTDTYQSGEFYGLGFGEPAAISATHGLGIGDLLDRLVALLPQQPTEPTIDESIRVAFIGRPNVGKSTLVNRILGDQRVVVSDIAGTTRDAIDLSLEVDGRSLTVVDTAGMRRQSNVGAAVEHYTLLRSQRAVERADVVVVVCDAKDGVTTQDLRIAQLAMSQGCATLLALNKWDETPMEEDQLKLERERVETKLRLRPTVLTLSALRGRNVEKLLSAVIDLADRSARQVTTPQLNRLLQEIAQMRQPPAKQGKRLRMRYGVQTGNKPPSFLIHVNDRKRMTRDYAFFVENRLREGFSLAGVPLIIKFQDS